MSTAKKDAAKETIETVTAASNKAVQDGFERTMTALNDASAFQKETVDAVIASATVASKSIEEINSNTLEYAKKSMEDGVTAAKSLASAKSVQDMIEIQSDFTKSALDAYLAQINRNSELMSGLFKDSFKPLNDRMAAAVEVMQSQR
ncbi:phasin family protein [Marinicauda salina]|uniref:Phasin family protein n=2 Tax=Marinicauda salina TaxID=2135793 RepID=A0A2U2BRL7_9PROT|nr:phasin family protein [Marinicauda salina]